MENQQNAAPKKKTGTKIFIVVVIVAVLALLGFRIWESLQPVPAEEVPPVNVKAATVELGSLSVTSPLNGRIAAENEAMVIPMAAGEVTAVHVALGDYVEKDAVLFEIDPSQMQTSYNQAAAGLSQAQAGVSQAKLARDNAKRDFDRMADLYAAGAISLQQYQQVELQYKAAEESLASANAAVSMASASMSAASDALGYCTVTAPISGYITTVNVSEGSMAGQSVAVAIADTSSLKINTSVSEYLVGNLSIGDPVDIYVKSLSDEPFAGKVTALSPAPGAGTLTYPMTIEVTDKSGKVKAGMFAEVHIVSDSRENVVCIPSDAVFIKGERSIVAVLDDQNIPTLKTVETGLDNGEFVEIISGLKAGETLVITGQQYVVEGTPVNIVE